MRNQFYAGMATITNKPIQEVVIDVDYLNFMPYLQVGPELMEVCVKQANYPVNFAFAPMTLPGNVVNNNNGTVLAELDTEIGCTLEMIMTRLLLAFGLNRSCSGHVDQVRKAVEAGNEEAAKSALKVIMERYKFGAIRLLKMKAS